MVTEKILKAKTAVELDAALTEANADNHAKFLYGDFAWAHRTTGGMVAIGIGPAILGEAMTWEDAFANAAVQYARQQNVLTIAMAARAVRK